MADDFNMECMSDLFSCTSLGDMAFAKAAPT
jgi:hypothetical protein